jgi:hypothetical protein
LTALTFGNGKFVAAYASNSQVSTDGLSWTTGNTNLVEVYGLTYGNGVYVAVSGSVGSTYETAYSSDGITWTLNLGVVSDARWYDITYGNGLFVAIGWDNTSSPAEVMTSPDAINWTLRNLAQSGVYLGIAFGPGMYEGFVGVGYQTVGSVLESRAAVSRDGLTWY